VLALFRSPARRPQLVLVGMQLALVLLAAALISISSGWATVAWKAAGTLFAGVMILCVRTITRNLARQPKPARSPAADSAPQPSISRPPPPPILRQPQPSMLFPPQPPNLRPPQPLNLRPPQPRIRAGPRRGICAVTAQPSRSRAHLICRALMRCAYSDFPSPLFAPRLVSAHD